MRLEEFIQDLIVSLVCVLAAKGLDELVEIIKEKASRKRGKHIKKP